MTKEETASNLLQMFHEGGVKKTELVNAIDRLIELSYCNPEFVHGLFRAKNIAESYNIIVDL